MAENVNSAAETQFGTEFWQQPEDILTTGFDLIYANVMGVLREEARERNSSAIDFLLIERIAFQYAWIRLREADLEGSMTDRTRRELNKDLIDVLLTLRKIWGTEDKDNAEEKLLKKVDTAIYDALKDLPEGQGREIMSRLTESFSAHRV